MPADRPSIDPTVAPLVPGQSETSQSRPPRQAVRVHRPWPTILASAHQRRRNRAVAPSDSPPALGGSESNSAPVRLQVFGGVQLAFSTIPVFLEPHRTLRTRSGERASRGF